LLERLIEKAVDAGVVVVAAGLPGTNPDDGFPSSMQRVLGVGVTPPQGSLTEHPSDAIFAPGSRIIVALPAGNYDFRSGSSLAAAHVSGVVALLLSIQPESSLDTISSILRQSQDDDVRSIVSINACDALNLAGSAQRCGD
jgi:subtilisin family serine protease